VKSFTVLHHREKTAILANMSDLYICTAVG
jgi:hypothetical protein